MAHHITAMLLSGELDPEAVERWDLVIQPLPFGLSLAFIDHYYTACWQKKAGCEGLLPTSMSAGNGVMDPDLLFPRERVLAWIAAELTRQDRARFAILQTEYFGGIGGQLAQLYEGSDWVDPEVKTINQALRAFGVRADGGQDEFDVVGLGNYRRNPEELDKYVDLADELGV